MAPGAVFVLAAHPRDVTPIGGFGRVFAWHQATPIGLSDIKLMKVTNSDVAYDNREFGALSPTERRYLEQWQHAASAVGIDAVEDLMQRRWPCTVDGAVIGIFMEGDDAAAWLVVKHKGQWAVACCADGTVSRSVGSLADALTELYVPDDSSLGDHQ